MHVSIKNNTTDKSKRKMGVDIRFWASEEGLKRFQI